MPGTLAILAGAYSSTFDTAVGVWNCASVVPFSHSWQAGFPGFKRPGDAGAVLSQCIPGPFCEEYIAGTPGVPIL